MNILTTSDKAHGTLGSRRLGWSETGHLRRRTGLMGLETRFSPLSPCIWPVSSQSKLIYRRDRALVGRSILYGLYRSSCRS